jgi:dienelactone hydrolase
MTPRFTRSRKWPGGPQVATWLTHDVPDAITHNFRAVAAPQRWGLMGYSTGGFCAAKLALQYPRLYGAAVSTSGYFSPSSPLLVGSAKLRQEDSPLVLIHKKQRSPLALLLAGSPQDPGTVNQIQAMAPAAQSPHPGLHLHRAQGRPQHEGVVGDAAHRLSVAGPAARKSDTLTR